MSNQRFRFTIRDVALLTVLAAVGTAWWIDRQKWAAEREVIRAEADELRSTNAALDLRVAVSESAVRGEQRINELREIATKSQLSPSEVQEVLLEVSLGTDFRTRVRAMAILPHLREREAAVDALRDALRERGEASAEGVVPLYATVYLDEMRATEAIEDIQNWIEFLKTERPYEQEMRDILLQKGQKRLDSLVAHQPEMEM